MTQWIANTMHAEPLHEGRFFIQPAMNTGHPLPAFADDDEIEIRPTGRASIFGTVMSVSGESFEADFHSVIMNFVPSPPGMSEPYFKSTAPLYDYIGREV